MSVLDDVRKFEERLVDRLRELEPLIREYDQLRAAAQQLGIRYTPGEHTAPTEAPRRQASSATKGRSGRGGAKARTGTAAAPRSAKTAAKPAARPRPAGGSTDRPPPATKPRTAATLRAAKPASTRPARGAEWQSHRPVLNTAGRAKRATATAALRPGRSTTTGARRASSRSSGTPSSGAAAVSGRGPARGGQRDDEVLRVVADHPGITVRELAERLGLAPAGLYRVVKRLTDAGRLRRDGSRLLSQTPAAAPDVPPSVRPTALPDPAAVGPPGGREPIRAAPPAAPKAAVSGTLARVYVYGVVPSDAELKVFDDETLPDVSVMELGNLAALVIDIGADDDPAPSQATIAHWQVLAAAALDTPVVPLRTGIEFASDDAVADQLLRPLRAELTHLLEHFPRLLDQTLQACGDHSAELAEILASQPEIERLRETIRNRSQSPAYDTGATADQRLTPAPDPTNERP